MLVVVLTSVKTSCAKAYKRVRIHVPVKVKHHHHTHTVVKHVHHAIPVHYEHENVHVIHPPEMHDDWDDDYHSPHGKMLESILEESSAYPDSDLDFDSDFENYDRFHGKRSRGKHRHFNNKVIGWKGRKDFDKIAHEYLASIKKQRIPSSDDYDDRFSSYDDDGSKRR